MDDMKLRKLSVDYLWDGLILSDDIYNNSGEIMLIPKGEAVIKSKLEKQLQFYGEAGSVMVHENTYLKIVADSYMPARMSGEEIEKQTGYQKLHQDIGNLFYNAKTEQWMDKESMEALSQEIADKLAELDPVTIFECMNLQRPVEEKLQRHSLNVAFLNGMQAKWMGMGRDRVKRFILAGLLHDIGKTLIPEKILNASRRLTGDEIEMARMHTVYSERMLKEQFDDEVGRAVRHHHERLDGTGYPDGIAGQEISLSARVTAISDIYDAMISVRKEKSSGLPFNVLDMFYEGGAEGLDRKLVLGFIKKMHLAYMDKRVIMSNGRLGTIRYIPFNDAEHLVIQQGAEIKQANDKWFCEAVAVERINNGGTGDSSASPGLSF